MQKLCRALDSRTHSCLTIISATALIALRANSQATRQKIGEHCQHVAGKVRLGLRASLRGRCCIIRFSGHLQPHWFHSVIAHCRGLLMPSLEGRFCHSHGFAILLINCRTLTRPASSGQWLCARRTLMEMASQTARNWETLIARYCQEPSLPLKGSNADQSISGLVTDSCELQQCCP